MVTAPVPSARISPTPVNKGILFIASFFLQYAGRSVAQCHGFQVVIDVIRLLGRSGYDSVIVAANIATNIVQSGYRRLSPTLQNYQVQMTV